LIGAGRAPVGQQQDGSDVYTILFFESSCKE